MLLYLLIHEQDTDAAWGCDVKPFTDKQAAQSAMRSDWQTIARLWEYDSRAHRNEDECECCENIAVIRDGDDVENWRIEEHGVGISIGDCPTPMQKTGLHNNGKTSFFFCMTVCQRRTGTPLGKRCGVVFADSVDEAESIAWEKYGGENACKLWVEEIPEGGFDFTVYKSEI